MRPNLTSQQYKEFYLETVPTVISFLRRRGVTKKEDMEDIIQETYIEAAKSWQKLNDYDARIAWLLTICHRQFIRFFKKNKFRKETLIFEDIIDKENIFNPKETAIEQQIDDKTQCERIVEIIKKEKNNNKQDVLRRYYIGGESLKDISATTGQKPSTITTWLSRFRDKVQTELKTIGMMNKKKSSQHSFSETAWSKQGIKL
ncbi:MAG: sigma-70 family RNA polymerase sigma factor [Bdellovibrionota bacterium]